MILMTTNHHKCVLCEDRRESRGLCPRHYQQFRRQRDKLPPSQWADFEQILIDRGQLLPETEEIIKPGNPFNQALIEFRRAKAGQKTVITEETEPLTDQVAEESKAIQKKKSQKPTVQQEADDVARKAKKAAKRKGITPKDKSE